MYMYMYWYIYIYSYIFITSGEKAYATVPRDALAQAGLQGHWFLGDKKHLSVFGTFPTMEVPSITHMLHV